MSAVKGKTKTGGDKWYFLTHHLIHETPRGELLQKKYGGAKIIGHAAIREYFNLREGQGENWECTNFSTPSNFPDTIVEAIKRGDFRGFGQAIELLTATALKDYNKATDPAQRACSIAATPAWKAYKEAVTLANKNYREALAPARKLFSKSEDFRGELTPARDAYNKATNDAAEAYREAAALEYKVNGEAQNNAFWDLFANPENRAKAWRERIGQ